MIIRLNSLASIKSKRVCVKRGLCFQTQPLENVSIYRFQGASWSQDEECIAYVAEEPDKSRPVFGQNDTSSNQSNTGAGSWEGQGEWMEDWGETYTGKRRPVLFVVNVERYTELWYVL